MKFKRHANDEFAVKAVDLKIGTDWSQLQAVVEETVARTRKNMCIHCIHLSCVACASPLIALWCNAFDDRTPCRAVELSMASSCSPNIDVNLQQLFQPFASSKLGIVRYDIAMYGGTWNEQNKAEFDAIWSACHRPTAQFITFELDGLAVQSYFLEQLKREPKHGGLHYTVEDYSSDVLQMVESYIEVNAF